MDTQASAFRWLIQLLSTQHKRLALSMILAVGYSLLSLVPYVLIYQLIANFLYHPRLQLLSFGGWWGWRYSRWLARLFCNWPPGCYPIRPLFSCYLNCVDR